ncbi:MAG: 2-phospho-L-lactate guanylyltransferase [Methanothrix sp.]|jgi:2-phospho-L-lactate guanylyltransferase|nr:2-phospho-L-lactate guanylyltransferase [Methanothrix sp.]HOI69941.1 2-phospho-L-lactate guanylyltransferase [Methanothrix sp.]HPY73559.1 2-phospho-L-lactate guanylyltransferase [Methanothrix sp.]HQA63194.1 2-phospho-L-lactate guanylyltransferase [Methanothrix sp.]
MRSIRVIMPFKLDCPKSRLSAVLSSEERAELALAMLEDVLEAVSGLGRVTILLKGLLPEEWLLDHRIRGGGTGSGIEVQDCPKELDEALNLVIEAEGRRGWPSDLLIAMADLPLMRPSDLDGLVKTPGDVVIAPGRGGGTNLILIRDPRFRVSYYGLSFLKHLRKAEELGLSAGVFESFRCSTDIDEPLDLVEVLIHGSGRTQELLRSLGFSLSGKREKARAEFLR